MLRDKHLRCYRTRKVGAGRTLLQGTDSTYSLISSRQKTDKTSEFESTRQSHNVIRVDFSLKCSQARQVFPIDIREGRLGVCVISVQRRRVLIERAFCVGDSGKSAGRLAHSSDELVIVTAFHPTELDKEQAWSAT